MQHYKLIFTLICLIGIVVPRYVHAENGVKGEKHIFTDFYGKPIPLGALLREKMDSLLLALKKEIATPYADNPSQCATIAVGALACGGPADYLVYSRKISNEKKIQDIASRYTEAEREWNSLSKAMSTCSMVEPPDTALVNGICVSRNKHPFQVPLPAK